MRYRIVEASETTSDSGQPMIVAEVEFEEVGNEPVREKFELTCEDEDGTYRLFEVRRRELENEGKESLLGAKAAELAEKEASLAKADPTAERRAKTLGWLQRHIAAGTAFGE